MGLRDDMEQTKGATVGMAVVPDVSVGQRLRGLVGSRVGRCLESVLQIDDVCVNDMR